MPLITRTEYLEIDSVALSLPSWWITDLLPLKQSPAVRGDDVLIPYAAGRTAKRRWVDATRIVLPMVIDGRYDQDGVAIANGKDGLQDHLDYLWTNVVTPPATSTGTRTAIWHLPDGSTTRTGSVHVLGLALPAAINASVVRAALDISIPAGRLS